MFLVWHVGNVIDPEAVDSALKQEMSIKLPGMMQRLVAKYGPPQKFYVSPYQAGRQSFSACKGLLKDYGTEFAVDLKLASHMPDAGAVKFLAPSTSKYGPVVGETVEQFQQRVRESFTHYQSQATRDRIWVVTHSDVMKVMAQLAGRSPHAELDYHAYFVAGERHAVVDYQQSQLVPLEDETLRAPPGQPVPEPARAEPARARVARDEFQPEPAARSQPDEDLLSRTFNPFDVKRKRGKKSRRRQKIIVTSTLTGAPNNHHEEFAASVKPPSQPGLFFDDITADQMVFACDADLPNLNIAKLQGLEYVKRSADSDSD